jgi:hypothetical protein
MQRKTYICIALMLLVSCFVTVLVFAHGGRTDANGGHYDRSTGEYHYHHGYPAHQHTDGVCPYDYDDKTNHYSASEDDSTDTTRREKQKETAIDVLLIVIGIAVIVISVYIPVLAGKKKQKKE